MSYTEHFNYPTGMAASASEELITLEPSASSPPAVVLATAGYDHTIRFWDVVRGTCIGTLQHNESQVNCMALTRDKRRLAVGGNPAIRLFDTVAATRLTEDGKVNLTANVPPLHVFEGHVGNVLAVGFHQEGEWMWSASEDGTIRIWDLTSPEYLCQREISIGCTITSAAMSPSQMELYVADQNGRVRVWDLSSNSSLLEQYVEEGVQIRCINLSPDGNHMTCIDHLGRLHLWRINVTSADYDDSTLLSLNHLCTTQAHNQYGLKCLFSPDSSCILSISADGVSKLWRISDPRALDASTDSLRSNSEPSPDQQASLELLQEFEGHTKWVWDCAFSADSAYIVTASSDNTARLWDVATAEIIAIYVGHSKAVTCLVLNDLPSVQ
jgi:G protein beta subunit-like protein